MHFLTKTTEKAKRSLRVRFLAMLRSGSETSTYLSFMLFPVLLSFFRVSLLLVQSSNKMGHGRHFISFLSSSFMCYRVFGATRASLSQSNIADSLMEKETIDFACDSDYCDYSWGNLFLVTRKM